MHPFTFHVEHCTLPREKGNCTERLPNWYYDIQKKVCSPFYYTGCNGNQNNFQSKEQCEADCPKDVGKLTLADSLALSMTSHHLIVCLFCHLYHHHQRRSFVIHSWISLIFFFIICWNIIDSDFIMFIYCLIYLEYRLSKMVLECTKVFLIWHIIMMEKAVTYLSHHHCCKFQIFYRKNASYGAANVLVFNFSWTLVWIFVGFSHYSTQFLLVTFYTSYGRLSISLSYIVYIVNYISYISYIFLSNICS